jgi:hypothetical protein
MSSNNKDESANVLKTIVLQVKAGAKSREEAFSELHKSMLQSSNADTAKNIVPETTEEDKVASTAASIASLASSSRFSQEERMVLINKLIDKNNKNNKTSISIDDRDDVESMGTTDIYQSDSSNIIPQKFTANDYVSSSTGDNNYNNDSHFNAREAWTENDNYYSSSRNDKQINSYNNRSFDETQIGNARYQRVAQTEAIIRQEMFKEFTFKPSVKTLPSHYGTIKDKDTPFYQRVTKWQKERDLMIKNRKQIQSKNETSDCTFHPKINRNSERAIKEIRGDANENVNDRLYKSNEVLYAQRAKYIEDELRREREQEDQECTFEPELKTKGKFNHVKSKINSAPSRDYDPSKDPELKKCTFTPKVNPIHKNMNSAQLYISTNVVDRLSRAPAPSEPVDDHMRLFDITNNNDRPIMDMTSFMGTLGMAKETKRPSSAPPKRPSLTPEELAKQKQNFQQFLGRQQITLITKEKKAEEMKRSSTPTFKPEFCRKSLEISNNIIKGEFLERVERDVLKRVENETTKVHTVVAMHPFTPSINKSSEKLRPRSAHEMSRGDQMRRETNQRMMRLRCEQKELSELTFQPEITKKAIKMGKTIVAAKLSEDPSKIIEWAKSEDIKKEESRMQQLKEKEMKELETCTFTPQTKDCPAYIKRIAKSMAVVKAARSSDQTSVYQATSKPTWK